MSSVFSKVKDGTTSAAKTVEKGFTDLKIGEKLKVAGTAIAGAAKTSGTFIVDKTQQAVNSEFVQNISKKTKEGVNTIVEKTKSAISKDNKNKEEEKKTDENEKKEEVKEGEEKKEEEKKEEVKEGEVKKEEVKEGEEKKEESKEEVKESEEKKETEPLVQNNSVPESSSSVPEEKVQQEPEQ